MTRKILVAAAAGVVGVVLGAGIGIAAAGDDPVRTTPQDATSMDEMHTTMRDQMPDGLADRCDEMHASMPEDMPAMDGGAMRTMTDVSADAVNDQHDAHHR